MNIIFGESQASALRDKFTVLELDTIRILPNDITDKAYAVIENIPLEDLPKLSFQKDLHYNLMKNYRDRDWNFCTQAIENLIGCFGGELDSFYAELQVRINNYINNDPGDDWNPVIEKMIV